MKEPQTYPVISPDALAEVLGCQEVVVVDCRFSLADPAQGAREYGAGHIAGAYYLGLDKDLAAPVTTHGGRHPLPDSERFAATLRAMGVNSGDPSSQTLVVAYDDSRFAFAARLWWLLRHLGHSRVRVLDGGYRAWRERHLPVDRAVPAPRTGNFHPVTQPEQVVPIDVVQEVVAGKRDAVLIDAREADRYAGVREPIDPVAGHIPGAVNFPWPEVTDPDGRVRPPDLQRQRWAGLPRDRDWIVYCGSGVTACVNLLSLQLAGIGDAKLYAGSWSDWCSHHGPAATGPHP